MEKTELLHTDSDGRKVVLHIELDNAGKEIKRVTYERYPDVRYGYLTALKAAKMILNGKAIKNYYIEALSVEALAEAEKKHKTGEFLPKGSIEINGKKYKGPLLKQAIQLRSCLIGAIELGCSIKAGREHGGLILQGGMKLSAIDPAPTVFFNDVFFNDIVFGGAAEFWHARFIGQSAFFRSRFADGATFRHAIFHKKADFELAKFNALAEFAEATFIREAVFDGASFALESNFNKATFIDDATFKLTKFVGNAHFDYATSLSLNLKDSRFEKLCNMSDLAVGKINLTLAVFAESLKLSSPKQQKDLQSKLETFSVLLQKRKDLMKVKRQARDPKHEFEKASDLNKQIKTLEEWQQSKRGVYSVNFNDPLVQGELVCDFGDLKPSDGSDPRPIIEPHRKKDWDQARKQYAWLKEQFRKRGAYDDEDDAHWWASECARMTTKRWRPLFLFFALAAAINIAFPAWFEFAGGSYVSPGLRFFVDGSAIIISILIAVLLFGFPRSGKWVVSKWIFGYGVRLKNLIATILIVIFGCSGLFWLALSEKKLILKCEPLPFDWGYLNSLYFSVITYATVGYGDVRAIDWAAGLAMVEGLLGIILNAALIVVIFRKLIR
ncbi:potassium channel family protein [bacterium]|nr:potassium channel family protein [bacterium]